MSNIPKTFADTLKKIYNKSNYLDKYGGSVIIAALILLVFWLIISYHLIMKKIQPIKADWVNQRCNPQVMPFAGIINAPAGDSKMSYTASNFTNCISIILKQILGDVFKPVDYAVHSVTKVFGEFGEMIDDVRKVFSKVRDNITSITQQIMNRMLNFMVPVLHIIVKMKDVLLKTAGTLTAALLTTLGIYETLKSLIGSFLEFLILSIISLVAAIVIAWIMPWTWPIAIMLTAIFAFVGPLTAIMVYWFDRILDMETSGTIPSSSCFDEDTVIMTACGEKYIKNIEVGEKLDDGTKVTAIFKMSALRENMYNYNDIIVSGSHKIMTPLGKCLSVSEHPSSEYIINYMKPHIYCLSTTSKIITIKGHIFSDWDEVDDLDWQHIKKRAYAHLPPNSQKSHIHEYLESGFSGHTPIKLEDRSIVNLKDIEVGDCLKNGERVLGIVFIDAKDLAVKEYNIKGNLITCAPNVPFVGNLGNVTTLKMKGNDVFTENKLYHLLTDTKFFNIKGIKFYDYNGVIEEMIEGLEILFPSF